MFRSLMLALGLTVSLATQAHAYVVPVFDGAQIVQTTLVAANTLQTLHAQITQTNQIIQGYIQDAKHLVSLPMSYIDEITGLYEQYNSALNQARGIAYTVKNAAHQFEDLYAVTTSSGLPLMQRAQAMLAQIRNAGAAANQMTAIFDRLCAEQTTVAHLQAVSIAAPGTLAAQQASNQLLGVLAEQNGSMQQMQATIGRMQVGAIMRQSVAEEQAQLNANQYLIAPEPMPWNTRPSNGFALPQ